MAKRNSRSEANESGAAPAQPPKNRRARTEGTKKGRRTAAVDASPRIDPETFAARAGVGDGPSAEASAGETRAVSMGSEPSEEDIRQRAYQRYLARGAEDGRHVEDWVEAESELKTRK